MSVADVSIPSTPSTSHPPHPPNVLAATASSSMPRYAFIVKALSPRDGGWVRLGGYHHTELDAVDFLGQLFIPLIVNSGDYTKVKVVRTIVF